MKLYVIFGLLSAFFSPNIPNITHYEASTKPKKGDYICWAKANKKACGAYAISKWKEVSHVGAIRHCMFECGRECKIEYCEKLD